MRDIREMEKEPLAVITLKRLHYIIYFLILLIPAVVLTALNIKFWQVTALYVIWLLPLASLVLLLVAPRIRYRNTAFALHPALIEIARGLYYRKRSCIPIDRIQIVEVSQGPLARRLGLSKVVLHSSGSIEEMPYLTQHDADLLAARIIERVKEVTAYV